MTKKINVLVRTSGGKAKGKELGFGHVYRCVNLLFGVWNYDVTFLLMDYGGASRVIKSYGFKKIKFLDDESNLKNDIKQTVNEIISNNIDLVIVDKYKISKTFVKSIKKYAYVVVISDLNLINYDADLLVDGFVGFENKIIENKYGTRCLLGPKYQILNKNFIKSFSKKNQV